MGDLSCTISQISWGKLTKFDIALLSLITCQEVIFEKWKWKKSVTKRPLTASRETFLAIFLKPLEGRWSKLTSCCVVTHYMSGRHFWIIWKIRNEKKDRYKTTVNCLQRDFSCHISQTIRETVTKLNTCMLLCCHSSYAVR